MGATAVDTGQDRSTIQINTQETPSVHNSETNVLAVWIESDRGVRRTLLSSPVSRHIVLMRTNVIHILNRVPEHDSLTFFMLHRTKCKPMHFERERFSDVTLTLTLTLPLNPYPNPNPKP